MLMTLRTVVLAVSSTLFVLALALYFVLGSSPTAIQLPPGYVLVGQAAIALALHLLLTAVGYRTPAIAPGIPADLAATRSAAAFSSTTFVRMAVSESLAIASIAAAFVITPGEYVLFLTGAGLSLALLAWHAFPSERTISKVQASLEREGGTSHLREKLGAPAQQTGPIQRL